MSDFFRQDLAATGERATVHPEDAAESEARR
jgi:hypothetical protein